MIRILIALAMLLVLAPGCKVDPTSTGVTEKQYGASRLVDHPVIDSLEVARGIIRDAYDQRNGRYICQTRTFDNGSWISIDVAEEGRGQILTLSIREPASAWGDPVTCYEGVAPEYSPGPNPVGRCTTYALWDVSIDLVIGGYIWNRIEFYENGNWNQMYLEWGNGWRCFLAMAKPNKPNIPCARPPYIGPKWRGKARFGLGVEDESPGPLEGSPVPLPVPPGGG